LNDWIKQNYNELVRICRSVAKQSDIDDLLQICVEQLLNNKKINDIPDEQKLYFFTKIVKNNFLSTKSKYHYQHRKFVYDDIDGLELIDDEYEESIITLDWVNKQIDEMKKNEWYYGRLFELYLQVGCSITKLSQKTTIPINSVSRDINKVRSILRQKRKKVLE
jgi:DNA-directed RNA polymerase specialized sigma24 family protein